MPNHFWGYFASHENLREIAAKNKLPFAHKDAASTRMAYEVFYQLESLGPLRVMSAQRNDQRGYVFVLGEDNSDLESIPNELKDRMEEMYHYLPRLWKYDREIRRFKTECLDGDGEHILWRGGDMNCGLRFVCFFAPRGSNRNHPGLSLSARTAAGSKDQRLITPLPPLTSFDFPLFFAYPSDTPSLPRSWTCVVRDGASILYLYE
ncbi:hypothetical protein FRC10_011915 [Ceratobasidium sp. 414]|nr:hypothetical protein FRC10_011915 [Ceratobasidium sp. 414]